MMALMMMGQGLLSLRQEILVTAHARYSSRIHFNETPGALQLALARR